VIATVGREANKKDGEKLAFYKISSYLCGVKGEAK
jgi:hypothetical protein